MYVPVLLLRLGELDLSAESLLGWHLDVLPFWYRLDEDGGSRTVAMGCLGAVSVAEAELG